MERAYGHEVCKTFINYAKFWEQFIGRDLASKTGRWYPFDFQSSTPLAERSLAEEWREEISMAHYSLFCSLAGARFQMGELESLLPIGHLTDKVFIRHWEAFECFYSRLGIAYFQIFHLWDCLALWSAGISRSDRSQISKDDKQKTRYKFISLGSYKQAWDSFCSSHNEVRVVRNNLTHFSSHFAHKFRQGYFSIPATIRASELWTTQRGSVDWRRTNATIRRDLSKSEQAFNDIQGNFIKAFGETLAQKGIRVRK